MPAKIKSRLEKSISDCVSPLFLKGGEDEVLLQLCSGSVAVCAAANRAAGCLAFVPTTVLLPSAYSCCLFSSLMSWFNPLIEQGRTTK